MKSLLLTLGHNSSAIFTDGTKTVGYEQERLDGLKSSSQFPGDAIYRIAQEVSLKELKDMPIFVSHWFDKFNKLPTESKATGYINSKILSDFEGLGCNVVTNTSDFTHHDAHMWSLLSYLRSNVEEIKKKGVSENEEMYLFVGDGFGNQQEVFSIYSIKIGDIISGDLKPQQIFKAFGYHNSLGLMYQYATSFCGMKENQDEYKFLGYESHIDDHANIEQIDFLDYCANDAIEKLYKSFFVNGNSPSKLDNDFINVESLNSVKSYWHKELGLLLKNLGSSFESQSSEASRCAVAYFIQRVIEGVTERIINKYNCKNVGVVGGIFYNVKLNNSILTNIDGLFCACPLAGDQGAGIGFHQRYVGDFNWTDMCWGKRNLYWADKLLVGIKNAYVFDEYHAMNHISELLNRDKVVNVIHGNMEFGPRALCNTSSLALPTLKNVSTINALNKRNDFMPMAPVVLDSAKGEYFYEYQYSRVIGSDKHMILTYDYKSVEVANSVRGVAHKYPLKETYSGRPQFVDGETFIGKILRKSSDVLINTSFNAHGNPIVFETSQIISNFKFQLEEASNKLSFLDEPYLVIVK